MLLISTLHSSIKHHASRLGAIVLDSLDQETVLRQLVTAIADLPGVAAITLGGSTAAGLNDRGSDLDVYMYYHDPLAASADREQRLRRLADEGTLEVGIPTHGL